MDFKFVETCLTRKIDLLVVKTFCYGLTDKAVKILIDVDSDKYVIGFENGEDAIAFTLKEQDKVLKEMIVDAGHRAQKDMFIPTPQYITAPHTIQITNPVTPLVSDNTEFFTFNTTTC